MKAVVIHSGGMDSSLCLALAMREFGSENVCSLTFNYEQRHSNELQAAQKICRDWNVKHEIIKVDVLKQVTDNALMNCSRRIESANDSMVIGRNGLMARLGAIYAHHLGAKCIFMGVMEIETDYRDCSRYYMDLMQEILQIDLNDAQFQIRTPLIMMTKAETIRLADDLMILNYLLENTVTCYEGIPKNGCGQCPACFLRKKGLDEAWSSL